MALEPLAADVAACAAVLRGGSASFATAALLLPRRVRQSATVLYAFCRVADDAIDLTPQASDATVDAIRARLHDIYRGRPSGDPIDRALAAVVLEDGVPCALFEALLEGLAWDARGMRYASLSNLYDYAARVAAAVGAMMTVVMGRRAPYVLARACDLGIAMQLTNIARDVGEDARRGRLYLPLEWMCEAGIEPDAWLSKPCYSAAIAAVIARLLTVADDLYARSERGIPLLPSDCRAAIGAARLIYGDIGRSIRAAGCDAVSRRAVVTTGRKVLLAARAFAIRWPNDSTAYPPLEAARFLVAACAEGP